MTSQAPSPRRSDLPVRALVGMLLIAAAGAALLLGTWAFWLLVVIASLLMLAEWGGLTGASATTTRLAQFALSVPLAIMCPWAAGPGFFALGPIAGAAFFVVIVTRRARLAFGVAYTGLPALALLMLRDRTDGVLLVFWALALVWACDIGAYFAGRAIGGPRLAPAISPNKTWAGLGGGVIAAGAFGAVMHGFGLPVRLAAATPLLAVVAQAGDLYESALKRRAGVKDSGTLLPGHGGVLDRLDGLVPVAPLAALFVVTPELISGLLS